MVIYFTSKVLPERPYTIYMGVDKHENEDLIKYGWPEDVWFHVDKLSSAHVYLRLQKNEKLDDIPPDVLTDCAQLVKANSIQGCKMNNIDIVYTMWDNLKKTGDMAVGQVGFHRNKEVRKVHVEKKINEIVNRLNKTKIEKKDVDLMSEKEDRNREERNEAKKIANKKREQEKLEIQQRKLDKEMRSYKTLFDSADMESNANNDDGNDSDDFM